MQGLVTGCCTNGRRLSDAGFVQALADAGLDHVQITLESHDDRDPRPDGRRAAAPGARPSPACATAWPAGLYVMTNTTLLAENAVQLERTLDFLAELGVPTVGLNALIYAGRGADRRDRLAGVRAGAAADRWRGTRPRPPASG